MEALICLDVEYICFINGIFFIIHSPIQKKVVLSHDDAKTPIKNTKSNDEINPSPASGKKKSWF